MDLKSGYDLNRESASKLLRISTRTLDRYIKAKRISSYTLDGRVFLNREEILNFKDLKNKKRRSKSISIPVEDFNRRMPSTPLVRPESLDMSIVKSEIVDSKVFQKDLQNKIDELNSQVQERQARLEIAHYRIGQLESQVRNSVSIEKYTTEVLEKERFIKDLKGKIPELENRIMILEDQNQSLSSTKTALVFIIIVILAIYPILILMIGPF